jgi:hypothetical protein
MEICKLRKLRMEMIGKRSAYPLIAKSREISVSAGGSWGFSLKKEVASGGGVAMIRSRQVLYGPKYTI